MASNEISRRTMLSIIGASALLPASRIAVRAQAPENWTVYRREDLGFQIEMPGNPVAEDRDYPQHDEYSRVVSAEVRISHGHLKWEYTQFRRPRSLVTAVEYEVWLFEVVPPPSGITQTALKVDGIDAVDISAVDGLAQATTRVVVIKPTAVLRVTFGVSNTNLARAAITRFLGSLRILGEQSQR